MRRSHCEVRDPEKILEILSSARIGRLATRGADGYPYITPVNFVYHGGKIYFHCAPEGEKLDNIARDPRVCFQVDIPLAYLDSGFDPERNVCRLHQFYHCVIIRGEARVLPDGPEKIAALNALVAKHEGGARAPRVHEEMPACKACKVVEIQPHSISAKSDLARNRPEEERKAIARYLKGRGGPQDRETIEAMGFDPELI